MSTFVNKVINPKTKHITDYLGTGLTTLLTHRILRYDGYNILYRGEPKKDPPCKGFLLFLDET